MKILSKGNKDYYDYLMGVYGQDELVVYDRRDCFPIDPTKKWGCDLNRTNPYHCSDFQNINVEQWFRKEVMCFDEPRKEIKIYSTHKVNRHNDYWDNHRHKRYGITPNVMEGKVYHFILEVGYRHYVFEIERYIDDNDNTKLHLEYELIRSYDIEKDKKVSHTPMALIPIGFRYHYGLYNKDNEIKISDEDRQQAIHNPILYSTYIPKLIPAEEIWRFLYEYISSLKDTEFVDTRTNEEHIESHGFDKKKSFRHRK